MRNAGFRRQNIARGGLDGFGVFMSAVLVGGGGGYIGSHVALAFVGIGQKTVVLDNLCTGWRDFIAA